MRILLGLTGSVATVLNVKLVKELQKIGIVDVILTQNAEHFITELEFFNTVIAGGGIVYADRDEWSWQENELNYVDKWNSNNKVLHIELRNKASVLVIAPCSMNTMAKLANGICDNLLTSVARAWDMNRPIVIAPAGNTNMWVHPITDEHIKKLKTWGYRIVPPQAKMLACKTEGMGAMAEISDIKETTIECLRWQFPLCINLFGSSSHINKVNINVCEVACSGIPVDGHPGAFLTKRKYHTHTGVDLYTTNSQAVYAVENGKIVGKEQFTGKDQKTPWWNDTDCLLVEGATGVICYGEIDISCFLKIGDNIEAGDYIGRVKRVLKEGKERPDIEGHSTSMLHIEIYKHGIYKAFEEIGDNKSDWNDLIDPTPFLLNSYGRPEKLLRPTPMINL